MTRTAPERFETMKFVLSFSSLALLTMAIGILPAAAQGAGQGAARPNREGRQTLQGLRGAGADAPVTPAEIQRMFDAYALVQAQDQLQIGDDQYPRFLSRFKGLQDIRRKALQDHTRTINDLRRLLMEPSPDESQLKEKTQALDDADARAAADIRKAHDALDQVLDVRQQARFRIFEEQMERRKLDLITRARQANRPKSPQ
jgi:hypothetical protein